MALSKSVTIPGFNYPATYFRIDKIERLDQLTNEAVFLVRVYKDQATAAASGAQGWYHGGNVKVTGANFTTYFSRAALAASGNSVHAQAYQFIKDYVAAKKVVAPAMPTTAQVALLALNEVMIANDFMGWQMYDGMVDA